MYKNLRWYIFTVFLLSYVTSYAQSDKVYHWDNKNDFITLGVTFGFFGVSVASLDATNAPTIEEIQMLDQAGIWGFERKTINNVSPTLKDYSDRLLIGSIALPFLHYLSPTARKEGVAILGMTFQAFFIADGITNLSKATFTRYRPFAYNPDVPIEDKLDNNSKFSFISGHTSVTTMLGVFSAKVFSDLYPNSKLRPYIWTAGLLIPATTGYLRYASGRHFITDVVGGFIVGATVGYLVPQIHKISNPNLSLDLVPVNNGFVFALNKKF